MKYKVVVINFIFSIVLFFLLLFLDIDNFMKHFVAFYYVLSCSTFGYSLRKKNGIKKKSVSKFVTIVLYTMLVLIILYLVQCFFYVDFLIKIWVLILVLFLGGLCAIYSMLKERDDNFN